MTSQMILIKRSASMDLCILYLSLFLFYEIWQCVNVHCSIKIGNVHFQKCRYRLPHFFFYSTQMHRYMFQKTSIWEITTKELGKGHSQYVAMKKEKYKIHLCVYVHIFIYLGSVTRNPFFKQKKKKNVIRISVSVMTIEICFLLLTSNV